MNFTTHMIFISMVVILPMASLISVHHQAAVAHRAPANRLRSYLSGSLVLWLSLCLVVGNWIYQDGHIAELGIEATNTTALFSSLLLIIFAALVIRLLAKKIQHSERFRHGYIGKDDYLREMLPRTRSERNAFYLLSVSAGVCEELIYRGFVFAYLLHYMTMPSVVVLSSLLFGLAHSYQGLKGIPLTATIGLLLALLYLYTGSLWASMVLHAAIDIGSGYLSWLSLHEEQGDAKTELE